jgi:poly-gamma-glutamate synthesis protein (capsule biosynthesis protein)
MKNSIVKNAFYYFLLVIVFISAISFLKNIFLLDSKINSLYLQAVATQPIFKKINFVTLFFVGDIMLDRGVELKIKKEGNSDFKFPFLKIEKDLKEADILFGNLEGPISDKGQKVGSIYSFRMDPKSIDGLLFVGFDILSVANNHMFDYSRMAMEDTFSRLEKSGIDYVGGGFNEAEAYSPKIKEINPIRKSKISNGASGTKIAFLAFNDIGALSWEAKGERSGMALLDKDKLEKSIKNAKTQADLVVVSMHFGDEYKTSPTLKQKTIAQFAIDSGADLVVGHHPHVIEPVEQYKEGWIAYSVGNFIFDQNFSEETMKGLILKVFIENGKIKEVVPVEFKINQNFQPEITGL